MKLIFVCLGNICRSPMAEGVFNKLIKERGLEDKFTCTSAGTAGYHIGHLPDARTRLVCELNKTPLDHRGRKFDLSDFQEFDLILTMDTSNHQDILALVPKNDPRKDKVKMLRSFEPNGDGLEVPDPYYGDLDDFKNVYQMLEKSCNYLIDELVKI